MQDILFLSNKIIVIYAVALWGEKKLSVIFLVTSRLT